MAKYPRLSMRITKFEERQFKFFKTKGLSARQVIAASSCPCASCDAFVNVFDENTGDPIKIPKGIIKNRK